MPIPIIAVVTAMTAGGTLVPHALGGFIVTSAGGYVAGTYLSTAAIGTLLTAGGITLAGGAAVAGGGAAMVSGAVTSAIGSAGIFGTTVGAKGLIGVLMSVGVLSAVPVYVPVAVATATIAGGGILAYGSYTFYKLRRKVMSTAAGSEAIFTEAEAKLVQRLLLSSGKCKLSDKSSNEPDMPQER